AGGECRTRKHLCRGRGTDAETVLGNHTVRSGCRLCAPAYGSATQEDLSMHHDVIIIGGSYAGMAAAMQLVRARRSVLVIDAGERRNRFASHSHGFLGQDGVAPGEIAANARCQLETYPTLTWLDG